MADIEEYDNRSDGEIEENYDDLDVDLNVDEYEYQNDGIDIHKREEKLEDNVQYYEEKDEDDTENENIDGNFYYMEYKKKKKTTNINRMTKFEYAQLFGKLAECLEYSQIDIPENAEEDLQTDKGSKFLTARKWIEFRQKYEIPLQISRRISASCVEILDVKNLNLPYDYAFKDDNCESLEDDFANNFTQIPYKVPR